MMSDTEYIKFEKTKLKNRKRATISSGEALRDIIPFQWNKDVLSGIRKISLK